MDESLTIRETKRTPASTDDPNGDELALMVSQPTGVRVIPLPRSGSLTIGRAFEAQLRIYDQTVSRVHLCIEFAPALRIIDLGSANGTFVEGRRIDAGVPRALCIGDVIGLGSTTMVLRRHVPHERCVERAVSGEPPLSEDMRAVLRRADRVAVSDVPVLILGETGVGKDVLAQRIHAASRRASAPFLRLNGAALSASLLESELFGHQKGAFTGAATTKRGLLQSAEGGTVLLDEVGELPLDLQVKLLLVVERREVLPIGAERARPIDVRFIAATHRDLPARVSQGLFREDLYHRLNGVPITIPPLRRRQVEIVDLARRFIAEAARSLGRPDPSLTVEACAMLEGHPWPGNIRELRATMERVVVLGEGDAVRACDLAECLGTSPAEPAAPMMKGSGSAERELIVSALAACAGNQTRASKLLGISRNTLIARLKKYDLARPLAERS